MNRSRQLAVGLAASCAMLIIAGLIDAAWATYGVPIIVTFRASFQYPRIDQIGSDAGVAYVNGGAVQAVLDATGNLHLDTDLNGRPGGRALFLAFDDGVPGTACNICGPPFTTPTLVDAFMSTNGVAVAGTVVGGLLQMPVPLPDQPPTTGTTNLNVNFAGWLVRFNPTFYPGSTQVSVTRLDAQNWTIEASSTDIAGLISVTGQGKVLTHEGEFFMPAEIMVYCPTC